MPGALLRDNFFYLLKALAVSKALGPGPGRGRTSKK